MQTQQVQTRNKRKNKVTLMALLATLVIVTGSIFAFFSDVVKHDTTITAGTLDLVASNEDFTQNGNTDSDNTIDNFNPGDVVTYSVDVANDGSKSAWLRGSIRIEGTAVTTGDDGKGDQTNFNDTFSIFEGKLDKAAAEAAVGTAADLTKSAGWKFNPGDTEATFDDPNPTIINGKAGLKDTEDETPNGGVDKKTVTYTIFFRKTALNKWQGKDLLVSFKTEGVQYRNNSGQDWTDLVKSPFGK